MKFFRTLLERSRNQYRHQMSRTQRADDVSRFRLEQLEQRTLLSIDGLVTAFSHWKALTTSDTVWVASPEDQSSAPAASSALPGQHSLVAHTSGLAFVTAIDAAMAAEAEFGPTLPASTSAAASFAPIPSGLVVLAPAVNHAAGAPLHIALDGSGDLPLSYSVTTDNPALLATIPTGNSGLKIAVSFTDQHGIPQTGEIVFQLFDDLAPNTTLRIKQLASEGFYDGVIFHRIIENFVVQGGDPSGTGVGGSHLGQFDDEYHPDLQFTSAGLLGMAKSNDDTNDSQFFIAASPARHLDFNHSIFGILVEGKDVFDAIRSVPTSVSDRPINDVTMTEVTLIEDAQNAVLRLSALPGATGTGNVTVTATDSDGNQYAQTFEVNIQTDSSNSNPFLLPLPTTIVIEQGDSYQLTLAAFDAENSLVEFQVAAFGAPFGFEVPSGSTIAQPVHGVGTLDVIIHSAGAAPGTYPLRFYVRPAGTGSISETVIDAQVVDIVVIGSHINEEALAKVELEITDLEVNPLSRAQPGQPFLLHVYVDDIQTGEDDEGVFSAYVDVMFDANLADVVGAIVHAPDYPILALGDTSVDGVIASAGGTWGTLSVPGPQRRLLFTAPMQAEEVGTITFQSAFSSAFGADFLLYNVVDRTLEANEIDFGSASLEVYLPEVSIGNASVVITQPGQTTMQFTVTLSEPVYAQGVALVQTFDLAGEPDAAVPGVDYFATSALLVFEPGQLEYSFGVTVAAHDFGPAAKRFGVRLADASGVTLADDEGIGTIYNEISSAPLIAIATPAPIFEGNDGSQILDFSVVLSAPHSVPVSVYYITLDGSAEASSDYVAQFGLLTFEPGETQKTISIEILGDTIPEPDETFIVQLFAPVNAELIDAETFAVGTILNDDFDALVRVRLEATDLNGEVLSQLWEGQEFVLRAYIQDLRGEQAQGIYFAYMDVEFDAALAAVIGTVSYAAPYDIVTIGDTDTPGLLNNAGATSSQHSPTGPDERMLFSLPMRASAAGTLSFQSADSNEPGFSFGLFGIDTEISGPLVDFGALSIDIFSLPSLSIVGGAVLEGDSSTTSSIAFEVTLSHPVEEVVVVSYATVPGTALPGLDYAPQSGMLVFPPGVTSLVIEVFVIGDSLFEPDETFFVQLSEVAGPATIDQGVGTGIILNDDPPVEAPLAAKGSNFEYFAGAPLTKMVARFTDAQGHHPASNYTAVVHWDDGETSIGTIARVGSVYHVIASHTYKTAGAYSVTVDISGLQGQTASVVTSALIHDMNVYARPVEGRGVLFWSTIGQSLIRNLNGGPQATALSSWLAATFPNLFGAGAGSNNLTGKTNAEVALHFKSLTALATLPEAQVMAAALNVYASTQPLSSAVSIANLYGIQISGWGLGSRSFNVNAYGAALGVANGATLNVYHILKLADAQATDGVIHAGNPLLRTQIRKLFDAINEAAGAVI